MLNIKFFKKEKVFKKKNFKLSSGIFWNVILSLSFLVIVAASLFGFYFFSKINKDLTIFSTSTTSDIEKNKLSNANNILDLFGTREQKSNEILNSPVIVVDPSL